MKHLIVVGTLLGLVGCGGDLSLCDITKSDCQESIYYADLRVRGDGYDPFGGIPPIRTIDEAQYRAELQAEAEQAAQNSGSKQPWWDTALALLRFMPAAAEVETASIENQVEQVAAYYEPSTKKVTVIDHKTQGKDPLGSMITLAHELVHALQDREVNLKIDPKTTDEIFAKKALFEGDATLYEYLFAVEADPTRIREIYANAIAWAETERSMFMGDGPKRADGRSFASLGPPYLAALYLVYPLGGMWMAEHYERGGNSAVRHAYGKAPTRSLEYLLPFGTDAPPATERGCASLIPADKDFVVRGKDVFGAVQVYAYMMAWGVLSAEAEAAASLWRDDVMFASYNPNTKKTAVAWRIELAQPIAAATLAQITSNAGPRIVQDGNTLLIWASDDADVMATWSPSTFCR